MDVLRQQPPRESVAKKLVVPLALALVLGAIYILTTQLTLTVPPRVDFNRMNQPRTSSDEVPTWYKGERPPVLNLDTSRFLGNVGEKAAYLSKRGDDYCLTLVENEMGLGGSCGTAEQVATKGLVLTTSDESGIDICVIALPNEYPTAHVPLGVEVLTRNDVMVAVLAPRKARTIKLTGPGLKPLSIDVVATP